MIDEERLRAVDYEVRQIPGQGQPWAEARAFIAEHHYSGGCSKTAVYVHGLFERGQNQLMGVAMWLPPTKSAAQSVNQDEWTRVLSLSRLAVHPAVPCNGATFLMSRSIREIRRGQRFVSLVTWADDFMNHSGAIYRGSNWTFAGTGPGTPRWEDANGRQVSNRATTSKTKAQMEARGCRLVGRFKKHKFVMHLRIQRAGERPPVPFHPVAWWALAV